MPQWLNTAGMRAVYELIRQPSLLRPSYVVQDIRQLPLKQLRERGIRYLIFDKDNCITKPYELSVHAPFANCWSNLQQDYRDRIYIVSNSAGTLDDPDEQETKATEQALGVAVLRHRDKKPSYECGRQLLDALNNPSPSQVAMIGDRLLTDVVFGNRMGFTTILTMPFTTAREPVVVQLLRKFENILLKAG
eukprot:TRINITY_DN9933_c0_g1_i1.p1 TRINITY_DN9933_c0_g1~~TRINITY_DN9933_c0_g1_i1.p1  ORF type:complete len:191 (+),score=25.33 TRINITY_DN9933_c0_g1_i1:27-599(+)